MYTCTKELADCDCVCSCSGLLEEDKEAAEEKTKRRRSIEKKKKKKIPDTRSESVVLFQFMTYP